jgi:hypothetical protein
MPDNTLQPGPNEFTADEEELTQPIVSVVASCALPCARRMMRMRPIARDLFAAVAADCAGTGAGSSPDVWPAPQTGTRVAGTCPSC